MLPSDEFDDDVDPDDDGSSFYAEYKKLPRAIRQYYSYKEYCWMTNEQRANIVANNTEMDAGEWSDA